MPRANDPKKNIVRFEVVSGMLGVKSTSEERVTRTPSADRRFREMYEENYSNVRDYCLRRLPVDDANDAVVEIFLIAWKKLDHGHRTRAKCRGRPSAHSITNRVTTLKNQSGVNSGWPRPLRLGPQPHRRPPTRDRDRDRSSKRLQTEPRLIRRSRKVGAVGSGSHPQSSRAQSMPRANDPKKNIVRFEVVSGMLGVKSTSEERVTRTPSADRSELRLAATAPTGSATSSQTPDSRSRS